MKIDILKQLIAQEIRRRRQNLGLTQREMGEKLGTTRVYATQMENNNPPITLDTLLSVCNIFECTLVEFFASIYSVAEVRELVKPKDIQKVVKQQLLQQGISANITVTIR